MSRNRKPLPQNLPALLRELIRRQKDSQSTSSQFAKQLGISRPTWEAIAAGTRRPGRSFFSGVLLAFDDLDHAVTEFLRNFEDYYGREKEKENK